MILSILNIINIINRIYIHIFPVEVNRKNLPHLVSFIDSIRDTRSSLILGKMISDTLEPEAVHANHDE